MSGYPKDNVGTADEDRQYRDYLAGDDRLTEIAIQVNRISPEARKECKMAALQDIRIISIEPIKWHIKIPDEFPCFVGGCHERATQRISISHNGATVKICVCPTCAGLPGQELIMGCCEGDRNESRVSQKSR